MKRPPLARLLPASNRIVVGLLITTSWATVAAAQSLRQDDVATVEKLPSPLTGYVRKITHKDGSIDFQWYRDAKLSQADPAHVRLDPPEFKNLGQDYPVTLKMHKTVVGFRSDFAITFQDAHGKEILFEGTDRQEDGTITRVNISVKDGVANGTVTTEDASRKSRTETITDMPMEELRARMPGGLNLAQMTSGAPAERPDDLSDISGINPDAVEAMRRCNAIARTMVSRQEALSAILRACPKPHDPGDVRPPCPSYERAAEQNAAINSAAMTCNKYTDDSYVPFFGPPRGVDAMASMPSLQLETTPEVPSADLTATNGTVNPDIKIEYKPQRSGATGIVLFGPGALLFDSTNEHKVGQLFSYPQKFSSGNYIVDFFEAGFSPLPVEVRQGSLTVVTAPLAGINLQTDNYKRTCVCLFKNHAILTMTKHWDSSKICKREPNTLEWPYPAWVAPGAYEVVTVDKRTSGSCTSHARAGYSPIAVTLETDGVVYVKTHSGGSSSTFVCHAKDYPEPQVGSSTSINKCLPNWWSSDVGNH